MNSLMISVSGVRGVVGESFTPDVVSRFSAAFGTFCAGGTVVIGRDARRSGLMVRDSVTAGLRASGCKVIDLGIVTTPTIQFSVKRHRADGGVAITASHNPIQWNAMKFIDRTGVFLNAEQGQKLIDIYEHKRIKYVPWDRTGDVIGDPRAAERHANHILGAVDVDTIRGTGFTVAIDACDSASSEILQMLLGRLGCESAPVNCGLTGTFPRGPEPTADNLQDLSEKVVEAGADVGFATDPDGDRLSIVDEKGKPLGEEYSVTMATEFVLGDRPGPVVTNVATTKAVEDIAQKYNCPFSWAPVGEVNVVEKMKKLGAVIGGEGNGGIINPAIQYARDAPAGMALILEGLSRRGERLSDLYKTLPRYFMVKKKIPFDPSSWDALLAVLKENFRGERMDLTDGIRVIRDSSWIYVRKSGTEPIMRVICEAKNQKEAVALGDETSKLVREALKKSHKG